MLAKFIGKKSARYKPNRTYKLATTYDGKYWWIVDINGKGRPVPYNSIDSFLDNWELMEISTRDMDKESYRNYMMRKR